MTETMLRAAYPKIEWDKPIRITFLDNDSLELAGYGCRYCIALYGYKPALGQLPGFSFIEAQTAEHIRRVHTIGRDS